MQRGGSERNLVRWQKPGDGWQHGLRLVTIARNRRRNLFQRQFPVEALDDAVTLASGGFQFLAVENSD